MCWYTGSECRNDTFLGTLCPFYELFGTVLRGERCAMMQAGHFLLWDFESKILFRVHPQAFSTQNCINSYVERVKFDLFCRYLFSRVYCACLSHVTVVFFE